MSNKVKVTVYVDPDEVRRYHAELRSLFNPSDWSVPAYAWQADLARQVYDALPPLLKFQPGDRVVRIRAGEITNAGRIGTVQGIEYSTDGLPYVLVQFDDARIGWTQQIEPNHLVKILED